MDYLKMSVIELKKICKEKGIKGYSKMKKRELINKLQGKQQKFISPVRPRISTKPRKKSEHKTGPPKTPMSPLLRRIIKKNKK